MTFDGCDHGSSLGDQENSSTWDESLAETHHHAKATDSSNKRATLSDKTQALGSLEDLEVLAAVPFHRLMD